MKILIIAEHDNQRLKPSTAQVIAAAKKLSDNIQLLVLGYQCGSVAEAASHLAGVEQVYLADAQCYQHFIAEQLTPLIVKMASEYDVIMASASTFGKNFMPRVAAKLNVAQISDIIAVLDPQTFQRPIYAGNAIATVKSLDDIKIITVRTTAFDPVETIDHSAPIVNAAPEPTHHTTEFLDLVSSNGERPDLTSARVVVSGGRALQSKENFELIEQLADKLNAAVGASRAAVDAGFVPNDYQVGQTGKIVAPELYFAIGISGAIQHVAGIKDSKVIVAINKDADAPIFQMATYGLVGDLFEIVPQLVEKL